MKDEDSTELKGDSETEKNDEFFFVRGMVQKLFTTMARWHEQGVEGGEARPLAVFFS